MKRFLIYTILLFASVSATMAQPTSAERWEMGNKAYMEGAYDKAIEEYCAILEGGEYSLELYYNLANAYYKTGDLGNAIAYYRKAELFAPRDADTSANLKRALSQTEDNIVRKEVPSALRSFFFLYFYLVVFLTPGTVVGLLPRLRLWICLHIVGVWSRLIGSSD